MIFSGIRHVWRTAGRSLTVVSFFFGSLIAFAATPEEPVIGDAASPSGTEEKPPSPPTASAGPVAVYVVPIKDAIDSPQLYILRRALKEAIDNHVDAVVLDMDTLGGEMGVTLDMMDALSKFPGRTYTYVNDKAISAGSYIAVATDEIYFAPTGRIGAAEVVTGGGEDVPEGMKRKVDSFMRATVRTVAGPDRYRADVQRAMMDEKFELKIGDKVLKPPGELLTLTAAQACEAYGDPPENLLGAGIQPDIHALLDHVFGKGGYVVKDFHLSWSETLAKWLNAIAPILLGAGILLLMIEFKTPGFGLAGISGITLLLLVLASHYIAGLAGYEPLALFVVGIVFIVLELLVFTGSIFCGVVGVLCFFGSLIWAMTDVWPGPGIGTISPGALAQPIVNLAIALVIAGAGFALALRFLPKTWFYKDLVNVSAVPQEDFAAASGAATATGALTLPPPGTRGMAVTDLRPLGEVEILGGRYQARATLGQVARGTPVVVVERKDFALAVKAAEN